MRAITFGLALGMLCVACSDDESAAGKSASDAGADAVGDAGPVTVVWPRATLAGDCDPLVPTVCALPFPSDVYLVEEPDSAYASGRAVRFGPTTLPLEPSGSPISPDVFSDLDGFSPGAAMLTHMPGATAQGLATPSTVERSVEAESPTVILDTVTGERVAHWVDLDQSTANEERRMLMLRPAALLETDRRYVVAIRGVKDASDTELPASAEFAALRDDDGTDPSVEGRREYYRAVFQTLTNAGVSREGLQLAWAFTTASREAITGRMLHMRDDALARVGDDGPEFVVRSVEDAPNAYIKHRIHLDVTVPLYLTSAAYSQGETPTLNLGSDGMPKQNGTMTYDVLVQVPNSAGGAKLGFLQMGHGLFGAKEEGQGGFLARTADEWGWVHFAEDFFGFSGNDTEVALNALGGDVELLRTFVDRQHQGHINQLLTMRMMTGRVARLGIEHEGRTLLAPGEVDGSLRAYRGDSQGGIMGVVYMSLSTDVTRGVLGETGGPYSLLLNRSTDWPLYGGILAGAFSDPLEVQLILGLIQMRWDQTEPGGWARYVRRDVHPGTPTHQVLIHTAIGDHQVTTRGAQVLARTMGVPLLRADDGLLPRPAPHALEVTDPPLQDESALVEYDFGLTEREVNLPTVDGCDPHDRVRLLTPSYEQQDHFFRTGEIAWFCDGVCDCNGANAEDGCDESFADQCQ